MKHLCHAWSELFTSLAGIRRLRQAFDPESRRLFNQEIFETTRRRTMVCLVLIVIIQISNIIIDSSTQTHSPAYAHFFTIGEIWLISVSVIFFCLFTYLHNHLSDRLTLRCRLIDCCWILLILGLLPFCYGEMGESGAINNFTLFIITLGIVPIMNVVGTFFYLLVFLAAGLAMAVSVNLPAGLVQQMVILAVLAYCGAWFQYSSTLQMFIERQKLLNSNLSLSWLAETDPLTGLLNRRGLEKQVDASFRNKENACLLMMDLDFFKNYNDQYLHLAGDRCLQEVSQCLKNCACRNSDVVARYGGEEFVIVVYNIKEEDAVRFALRVNNAVYNLNIPFNLNRDVPYLTISIGMALLRAGELPSDLKTFSQQLLEAADQELYNAKEHGRNCVSFQGRIYRNTRQDPPAHS